MSPSACVLPALGTDAPKCLGGKGSCFDTDIVDSLHFVYILKEEEAREGSLPITRSWQESE